MKFFLFINFIILFNYISVIYDKKYTEYLISIIEIEIPCKLYFEKINKKEGDII